MKNSVYKNKGGKYASAPARAVAFLLRKNKGGKYASAPARTVAFFTSKKQ